MLLLFGPFAAGFLSAVLPGRTIKKVLALLGSLAAFLGPVIFGNMSRPLFSVSVLGTDFTFLINPDNLSLIFATLIGLLAFLATLFSFNYVKEREGYYYGFLLTFVGAMEGAVLAGNFLTLFFFWELMTAASYFLIIFDGTRESENAGKKYFLMTGLLSLLMLFSIFGLRFMAPGSRFDYNLFVLAFLLAAGVKAGIVPLHSWLPEAHPAAPSPVSALLSGVMIKIGIYLLIRIIYPLLMPGPNWLFVISFLGAVTILIGVINALAQHDFKRLLAFHSISQVGYILLGIGCGTGLGLAGGIFHVINHALFKGLLFLISGVILTIYGTRDLDKISGLFRKLPLTFAACLVASLSISGMPPFNGFASKWIIYQALIAQATPAAYFFLVAAMFGSALTLASFLKVLAGLFFGNFRAPANLVSEKIERGLPFGLPLTILSLLCITLGVWPNLVLNPFILPMVEDIFGPTTLPGLYSSSLATGLLVIALLLGLLLFFLLSFRVRRTETYIGGNDVTAEMAYPATHFYKTIEDGPLAGYYRRETNGSFDLYFIGAGIKEIASNIFAGLTAAGSGLAWPVLKALKEAKEFFREVHNGLLQRYILWLFVGLLIFLFIFW
ncbi:MAG: proton-conducting transporter membrane subunit [Candidatus Omnitrophota bacterium]